MLYIRIHISYMHITIIYHYVSHIHSRGHGMRYWPDGFPGYDHIMDPFYDDCDPHIALKAPEW